MNDRHCVAWEDLGAKPTPGRQAEPCRVPVPGATRALRRCSGRGCLVDDPGGDRLQPRHAGQVGEAPGERRDEAADISQPSGRGRQVIQDLVDQQYDLRAWQKVRQRPQVSFVLDLRRQEGESLCRQVARSTSDAVVEAVIARASSDVRP